MALAQAPYVGPPKSYTKGRSRPLQGVALHCTEGSEGPVSAEAGVAYDKRRTDGTSTHEFADSNGALCEVRAADRAHTLRFHGNEIFYSIEICARAGQTPAQWADATSRATLDIVSQRLAALFIEQGWSVDRLVRLSVAQTRAAYYAPAGQRPIGVVGHVDVTKAFPEDQGDHWDPGPNFPWATVLAAAQAYMLAEMNGATDMSDVYYQIQSSDPAWNGKFFVSNRINRRPVRTPGSVLGPATSGATKVVLTDAGRTIGKPPVVEPWPDYLDDVAGPELVIPNCGGDAGVHDHDFTASGTTGPAKPVA